MYYSSFMHSYSWLQKMLSPNLKVTQSTNHEEYKPKQVWRKNVQTWRGRYTTFKLHMKSSWFRSWTRSTSVPSSTRGWSQQVQNSKNSVVDWESSLQNDGRFGGSHFWCEQRTYISCRCHACRCPLDAYYSTSYQAIATSNLNNKYSMYF